MKEKINIKTNPTVIGSLADESFSDDYGARQVEKIIRDTIHELVIDILQKDNNKNSYTLSRVKNIYKLV